MDIKKHYGYLENLGTRVIVVFRSLPAEPASALVIALDSLPDGWRDEVLNAVNSQAGQATVDLYTALQNRSFSEGTNVLTGLHTHGHLRKVPVSQVTMTPVTGQKVPLSMVNAACDKKLDTYVDAAAVVPVSTDAVKEIDPVVLAKALIVEAALLEETALAKRTEAYSLAPELKPGRGRTALAEDEKAKSLAAGKEKRLERDRAAAAKAKVDKKEQAMNDRVNKKILRDAARSEAVDGSSNV